MAAYGEKALKVNTSVHSIAGQEKIIYLGRKVKVEQIGQVETRPVYAFLKRTFDFVAAVAGAVVAAVPMAVVAVCVKADSKGPVLYTQERLGLNGKPFTLYKFRSMREDAEKDGAQWARENDDRVTRVGRFLRKTRLDELPQLWNIFRGQMSLVGPRPERAVFYEEFEKTIPGFKQRLMVKPGLTGWAQVNGGYNLQPGEKILYDVEYIKNRSVALDLKCLFKTVRIVFSHDGAR